MNKSQHNAESDLTEDDFWLKVAELSLDAIWDNPEDGVYAELLD